MTLKDALRELGITRITKMSESVILQNHGGAQPATTLEQKMLKLIRKLTDG
jgi:hypothetical protein